MHVHLENGFLVLLLQGVDYFFEMKFPSTFNKQGVRSDFIRNYLNYVIYKFLGIKAYKFKNIKSGHYLIKDLEQKTMLKNNLTLLELNQRDFLVIYFYVEGKFHRQQKCCRYEIHS